MVRLGKTKHEDRGRAAKYQAVGRALLGTAGDLALMGEGKYGNGLAIIAIHAAVAYTDALTVAYREIKSTDGEHLRAAEVLVHALGSAAHPQQVSRLLGILDAKSHASYSGNYYTLEDGREILRELERYVEWAEERLASRPLL
jgi:hypothetical protein